MYLVACKQNLHTYCFFLDTVVGVVRRLSAACVAKPASRTNFCEQRHYTRTNLTIELIPSFGLQVIAKLILVFPCAITSQTPKAKFFGGFL